MTRITKLIRSIGASLLTTGLFLNIHTVKAQINTEVFGQNRVQYRDYNWKFFDTKHFRVYHYDRNGTTLARYVCEQAERDVPLIERRVGSRFPRRFDIILYNNYDECRQTNVGLKYESQLQDVGSGTLNFAGDKMLVYFNGVHTDLRRQIRSGIARVLMQRMMFGEDTRQVVKNSILLNLPRWTTEGFIAYLVDGWDPKSESEWKNMIDTQPKAGFFTLADQHPELAGKAFWKYISDRYGEDQVKTLLFAMQQRASLNKGIRTTLGMKVKPAYDSALNYFKAAFAQDALVQETPDSSSALISIKLPRDGTVIRSMRVSPRGNDVAYCEFREGEYKVYIQHTSKQQQRSLILSTGRSDFNELVPDADYPQLAWSNNGYKVAILYRYKRQTRLRIYNSLKAKIENYIIPPNRFDRVLGMTFNETDDKLVFSAIKKSQTDLYLFILRGNKMTNITNDPWDDVQPWFVSGGSRRGILFLSNRPAANLVVPAAVNELPAGPMNLYFYDTKTESPVLLKCTNNKTGNLTQPIQYGSDNLAYLKDDNGIQNKYVIVFGRDVNNLDSPISVPVTNYSRSILSHQYNPASNQVADVLQQGDAYKIYFRPMLLPGVNTGAKTLQPTTLLAAQGKAATATITGSSGAESAPGQGSFVKRGTLFQSEFIDTDTTADPSETVIVNGEAAGHADTALLLNPVITDSTYLQLKAQPYRLNFKPDFFTLRLDNTVLFSKYQSASAGGGQFLNPPLGGMLSVSLNDALENHRFTGGIRLQVRYPLGQSGLSYFLQYQNFTKRVDWGILFYRTNDYYNYDVQYGDSSGRIYFVNPQLGKVTLNMLQGSASLPFDRIRRIGLHFGVRQDILDFKALDSLSLIYTPRESKYWLMSRGEYVFDNSRPLAQNLRTGFRYKIYAEYMYGLSKINPGGFYNLGFDFRYYKPIFRNTIFAARVAGAHSAGDQKILYLMGGVDNWLSPKSAAGAGGGSGTYAFQSIVTNMRGYKQSARTGNTHAVANFELRSPILSTILQRPIQSNLLRSLQLIGFADAGHAWNGLVPDNNNLNNIVTGINQNGTVIATAKIPTGFALGYGAGMRAMLLGYYMRLDAAWNIQGIRKPIWYLSIGTDF
jgi:hypothetical protein